MLKRKIILLSLLGLSTLAVAQSNIRLSNYWGNMYFLTPATIFDKYAAVFSVAAKKQWVGIEGSPATLFASGTTFIEKTNTQLGFNFIQDKVGYTSVSNLQLSYGFSLQLDYIWQLHLGIGGNYQYINYDPSQMSLENDNDAFAYAQLNSQYAFDADLGIEFATKSVKAGIVSQNLFDAFSPNQRLQTNTNLLYFRYREMNQSPVNIGAGVCAIQIGNIYQLEFNTSAYFKFEQKTGYGYEPQILDVGLFYRTASEVGLNFGFNISKQLHVSYTYDYHFGSLRLGSFGTNEIMLTYHIPTKCKCHNMWY